MVYHEGGLSSRWSVIRVVFHQQFRLHNRPCSTSCVLRAVAGLSRGQCQNRDDLLRQPCLLQLWRDAQRSQIRQQGTCCFSFDKKTYFVCLFCSLHPSPFYLDGVFDFNVWVFCLFFLRWNWAIFASLFECYLRPSWHNLLLFFLRVLQATQRKMLSDFVNFIYSVPPSPHPLPLTPFICTHMQTATLNSFSFVLQRILIRSNYYKTTQTSVWNVGVSCLPQSLAWTTGQPKRREE